MLIIAGCGLIMALYAGNWIAEGDYLYLETIFGGLVALFLFLGFGKVGYLLIPVSFGLVGQISVLPLPFSVQQLVIMLATGFFIAKKIFKSDQNKFHFEKIDLLAWASILYLGIVYLRNPVGINALGGDLVGGKPYVDFILGVMSYVILGGCVITPKQSKNIVKYNAVLMLSVALICTVVMFLPSIGNVLGKFYSSFSTWSIVEGSEVEVGETRLTPLQGGWTLVLLSICCANPMKMLSPKNYRYLLMYLTGIIMILLSGFRSALFNSVLLTALGSVLRDKTVGAFKFLFAIFIFVSLFSLISYSDIKLPLTAQRGLSFLPGNWDPEATKLAEDSSKWRYRMWELMLTTDRYIHSKMWGDGYGFTRKEFEIMENAHFGLGGFGGQDEHLEPHMIQGTVHSGPVSTIKRVGYVGLGLLVILMGGLSLYGFRVIKMAQGTPFQLISLYYGLPVIIAPFVFIFIFGDYNDITTIMFELGMLKMIYKSCSLCALQAEV
ncbi:MAG: hypothetical protein NTW91_11165 [Verrucomicrobia bacterium]|nr:hypothetical protein [Verrucomicrobiota bacterium]